jgi:methyl-accepting chemotaxis protein
MITSIFSSLLLLAAVCSIVGLVVAISVVRQDKAVHDTRGQWKNDIEKVQSELRDIIYQVGSSAHSIESASYENSSGNADLGRRTVQQSGEYARQASQLVQNASRVAAQGEEVVAQVVETMRDISDASHRIADIIAVIDGIAFQTNILALNAAIEAARAGEQGRGFAVVASEVRNLAGRSAEAAKEIKSLIDASVERVEQGSALVDQAGMTMTEVVSSVRRVTDIMGEISAASSEQSAGLSQVGEAVTQMDQATQQNAALVEQMADAADVLREQARRLVGLADSVQRQGEPSV